MMGQAKQRKGVYETSKAALLGALAGDELIVAQTSISLYERFVLPRRYTGGCYMTSMFLHRYLLDERGITTKPVVGYINDGTDDIYMSHAWIEYGGRKIDLTLSITEYQDVQLSGALLILDHQLKMGQVNHTYYTALKPAARAQYAVMGKDPKLAAILEHKAREHAEMCERAADPALMADYIAGAPVELGYKAMRSAVV